MKVWITKHALTQGVEIWNGKTTDYGMFERDATFYDRYRHKGEWWPSRAEAIADALKRRDRKIASLKKQLARLEALTFEDTPE